MAKALSVLFLLLLAPFSAQAFTNVSAVVITGRTLVSESLSPNGIIESNETVTFSITLSNAGDIYAPGVVATIVATNGITPITAQYNFGTMLIGEVQTRDYTFRVDSTFGRVVQVQMMISTNGVECSRNVFDIGIGSNVVCGASLANQFVPVNRASGKGQATDYPSTISFSNLVGSVSGLRVTLHNYTHDFPEDVDVMLVSPQGTAVMLMSDCGGPYAGGAPFPVTNVNLTFDSSITNLLPTAGYIYSGKYSATDYNYSPNEMESPAPTNSNFGAQMSLFHRQNPNGAWQLFMYDSREMDSGYVRGGWSLTLTIQPPPALVITDNRDGRLRLTLNYTGYRSFYIDYTSNFVNWYTMGQTPANADSATFFDSFPRIGQRAYRARRTAP